MTVGFTCGVFDLFHAGHVLMLENCKQQCDELLVGIKVDPTVDEFNKNKPVQSILERIIEVKACKFVDKILVYSTEEDLNNILGISNINVRFIGEDHKNKPITGQKICDLRGIKIIYLPRTHTYSTSNLRERVKNA